MQVYYKKNKAKICQANKRYRLKHPIKTQRSVDNWRFKVNYGITLNDYKSIFRKQNGKCAVCRTHQRNLTQRLSVDHDHVTGKVRGLLCSSCNSAIGKLGDSVRLLKVAIKYLTKSK